MRPPLDDWRRQGQERFMKGLRFVPRRFRTAGRSEHEHCEFCSRKFSEDAADLRDGYATEDSYRWVCPACFEDFREEYGWTLGSRPSGG